MAAEAHSDQLDQTRGAEEVDVLGRERPGSGQGRLGRGVTLSPEVEGLAPDEE